MGAESGAEPGVTVVGWEVGTNGDAWRSQARAYRWSLLNVSWRACGIASAAAHSSSSLDRCVPSPTEHANRELGRHAALPTFGSVLDHGIES